MPAVPAQSYWQEPKMHSNESALDRAYSRIHAMAPHRGLRLWTNFISRLKWPMCTEDQMNQLSRPRWFPRTHSRHEPVSRHRSGAQQHHDDLAPGGATLIAEYPLRRASHASSNSSWRLPAQDLILCVSALGKVPIHSSVRQKYLVLCSALKAWRWGSPCSAKYIRTSIPPNW